MAKLGAIISAALLFILSLGSTVMAAETCPGLTGLQKAAGFITFVNTMWVLAIALGVLCLSFLVVHWCEWLLKILKDIPLAFYEALFYLSGAGLAVGSKWLSPEAAPYVGLTGCLLLLGAFAFTAAMRRITVKEWQVALAFAVVWGAVAVWHSSAMIGFISVGALMVSLGFSGAMGGLSYAIGFKDKEALGRATAASFTMLAVFVGMRIFATANPTAHVFEFGALFLGSFVGYLGLLIHSSRWYEEGRDYGLAQVVTTLLGCAAIFVGSVWQIGELQKIGGTFFVLYILEKIFEVPVEKRINYAYLGLLASGLLYGFAIFVKTHPEVMKPYLLFF